MASEDTVDRALPQKQNDETEDSPILFDEASQSVLAATGEGNSISASHFDPQASQFDQMDFLANQLYPPRTSNPPANTPQKQGKGSRETPKKSQVGGPIMTGLGLFMPSAATNNAANSTSSLKRKRGTTQSASTSAAATNAQTSLAAAKQTEVTALLTRIKTIAAPLTVWSLLQVFDFVELSKLAQYQGDYISPHATKKEMAESVLRHVLNGDFSQEMKEKEKAAEEVPPSAALQTEQSAGPGQSSKAARTATAGPSTAVASTDAPHDSAPMPGQSGRSANQTTMPFVLRDGWHTWKPAGSRDQALLLGLGRGDNKGPDTDHESPCDILLSGELGWRACPAATEALLEFDNECYQVLRILREGHKTAVRDWAVQVIKSSASPSGYGRGLGIGRLKSRSPAVREIRQHIMALQPSHLGLMADHGSGSSREKASCGAAGRANASTQTVQAETPIPALRAYASHQAGVFAMATKVLRFDRDMLGLTLKETQRDVRDQARHAGCRNKTILQGFSRERVDEAVARLLCVGDELIMVNGEDVTRLPFSYQVDLLTTAGRPIFLTFNVA